MFDATNLRNRRILVTGGLGFIGARLSRRLLAAGSYVRILDSALAQVHGTERNIPSDLGQHCDVRIADIRSPDAVRSAMADIDGLVHLAAETGTGQSMHAAAHHLHVNTVGSALVLEEALASSTVASVVLASSRAVYGEGSYLCATHGLYAGRSRRLTDLRAGKYELRCPLCDEFGVPTLTAETAAIDPQSIYGMSKHDLERMAAMLLRRNDQSTCLFRFQNVYGPGQSLINPYTGILAIFSSLAKRQQEIFIFEDGAETRDFVYIDDAVDAIIAALGTNRPGVDIFNVGTGVPTPVTDVARRIAGHFSSSAPITISRFARAGDVRHNAADTSKVHRILGIQSEVPFETGLKQFLDWVADQDLKTLEYGKSLAELESSGAIIRASD